MHDFQGHLEEARIHFLGWRQKEAAGSVQWQRVDERTRFRSEDLHCRTKGEACKYK
jgi:hypothetical protein